DARTQTLAGGHHVARGDRRAVLRRYEKRAADDGGRRVFQSRAGARIRVPGEAIGPARVEDALRQRAVGGEFSRRRVAAPPAGPRTARPRRWRTACASWVSN